MDFRWAVLTFSSIVIFSCSGANRYSDYYSEPACKNARSACEQADKYLSDHKGQRDDYYLNLQLACQESMQSCQATLNDKARLMNVH